jgi:hypothetical protein
MTSMNQQSLPETSLVDQPLSRRGVLRAGGITVALAALVAACAEDTPDTDPARVGSIPPPITLPEGVVTDGVLFRTAASMHYSFIDAHNIAKKLGNLTAEQTATIDGFIEGNKAAIEDIDAWTVKAGAEVWTCANPRFDRVTLIPITEHITGRPKEGNEETDVPPSDDPNRDCLALSVAVENLSTAMHQSFVTSFSLPEYRAATMHQGQAAARRAAVMALEINPANIVTPSSLQDANVNATTTTAAATTTTVQDIAQPGGATTVPPPTIAVPQEWYAIPSQFGLLSAVQLSVGAPSSGGTQFTINMDTPSLNSYIYDYMTDC